MIVDPTGGGTGVVGMAKAFNELEAALAWSMRAAPDGLRPERRHRADRPSLRKEGADDTTPVPACRTIATGLNMARHIGPVNVLRIIRATRRLRLGRLRRGDPPGHLRGVASASVRVVDRGAATLAALPDQADRKMIRAGNRVVLVNTASPEKDLPTIRDLLDGGL